MKLAKRVQNGEHTCSVVCKRIPAAVENTSIMLIQYALFVHFVQLDTLIIPLSFLTGQTERRLSAYLRRYLRHTNWIKRIHYFCILSVKYKLRYIVGWSFVGLIILNEPPETCGDPWTRWKNIHISTTTWGLTEPELEIFSTVSKNLSALDWTSKVKEISLRHLLAKPIPPLMIS